MGKIVVCQPLARRRFIALAASAGLIAMETRLAGGALGGDAAAGIALKPQWQSYFTELSTNGVVCFKNPQDGITTTSDLKRCRQSFLPASTFKIANALIAFETAVVASPDDVFEWDGNVRSIAGTPVAAWNRSQTLKEAFANSTVWIFQEIARRVGPERMSLALARMNYANSDISGAAIDEFWLSGNLRISAVEQIEFIERLWAGRLPVSERTALLVKEMMRLEAATGHVLYGKTGWATQQNIGWFVGAIEHGGKIHPFALNMDLDATGSLAAYRKSIVNRAAQDLGLL